LEDLNKIQKYIKEKHLEKDVQETEEEEEEYDEKPEPKDKKLDEFFSRLKQTTPFLRDSKQK
jgi:hypothetical protein